MHSTTASHKREQGGDRIETTPGADLYSLLEYVEVPSRFVGTERLYNPLEAVKAGMTSLNWFSRLRDPGKVNINTITDPRVWQAATRMPSESDLDQFPHAPGEEFSKLDAEASWNSLAQSRRGYEPGSFSKDDPRHDPNYSPKFPLLHSAFPSQFHEPFRSYASLAATLKLESEQRIAALSYPNWLSSIEPLPRAGVEATVLRSDSFDVAGQNITRPLLGYTSNAAYNDTERNAQFRYDGIQRLANLTTNHSNVFAIWITVGYFEVEPVDRDLLRPMGNSEIDKVYPDGLWLGQELGADRGDSKRHRAFYIIDRSVPVAFEPGKNHNVDKAVMLRRFIE